MRLSLVHRTGQSLHGRIRHWRVDTDLCHGLLPHTLGRDLPAVPLEPRHGDCDPLRLVDLVGGQERGERGFVAHAAIQIHPMQK